MTSIPEHNDLEFAINLALRTGNILLSYYELTGLHAEQKSDRTVVTEADIAADHLITQTIQAKFPLDRIISEESFHIIEEDTSATWIIDPLDGTTNFSLGLPIWGISIARIVDGYPGIGVIYFPMIKELYTCSRGLGAFLNNSRLFTRPPDPNQPMSFFACCSRSFRYYNIDIPYKPRIYGSGAYTLCMVARGSALLGLDAASKIWDLAAGWLLVEEAGGKIATLDGQAPFPLTTGYDYNTRSFPLLCSATSDLFNYGNHRINKKSGLSDQV